MSGLVNVGEPLVLADGRQVFPNGKIVDPNATDDTDDAPDNGSFKLVEVPNSLEAQKLVTATRRRLADIPALPRAANAVSAVLSYSLFGLTDDEIALALSITEQQVANIRSQEAYARMHEAVVSGILEADSNDVRELLAKQSRNAVKVMVGALKGEKVGALQFAASKEVLDRSGHRPVDVVEHRHKMEGGLVIEVIKRDDTTKVPIIEMDVE